MELRQAPRVPVHGRISFTGTDISGEGTLINISSWGWMAKSDSPIPPGIQLTIRISLPDQLEPLEVPEACVQWSNGHTFGMKGIRMELNTWKRLRHVSSNFFESSHPRF